MIGDFGTANKEGCLIEVVLPDLTENNTTSTNASNKAQLEAALEKRLAELKGTGLVARKFHAVGDNTNNLDNGGGPSGSIQCMKEDLAMEETHSPKPEGHDLQDLKSMYEHEGDWDNEEDDKDWDPDANVELVIQWFCTNCTDANPDDECYCKVCKRFCTFSLVGKGSPHFGPLE